MGRVLTAVVLLNPAQSSEIRNRCHGFVHFAFFGLKEVEFWHALKAGKLHAAIQAYCKIHFVKRMPGLLQKAEP